jgi:metallophosphoesterase (TIGR00282 family)
MKLNILCIGDIVGRPGRRIVAERLKSLVNRLDIGCVIANHAAGRDFALYKTSKGPVVAVVALIGRMFMKPADCPYAAADRILPQLQQKADIILVDFHAEATSEKVAMGYHLDGRVSCCFGTHTHVATADERILPKGTAYITDIGMTGPHDSVLGRGAQSVLKSFRTQMPFPFEIATGDLKMNAILVTVDSNSKRADSIERLLVDVDSEDSKNYDSDDGKPEYFNNF